MMENQNPEEEVEATENTGGNVVEQEGEGGGGTVAVLILTFLALGAAGAYFLRQKKEQTAAKIRAMAQQALREASQAGDEA